MTLLGTVISTKDSPNLDKIEFIINENNVQPYAERGQFVTLRKGQNLEILGQITGIKKYNAYYANFDFNIQELASREFDAIFPTNEWESTVAELKPLGELNKNSGKIRRLKFPVSPGSKVYTADPAIISMFLGFDDNGLFWGEIPANNVKVQPNLSRLLRKHLAILAISGAGKSYATTVLLEELYHYGKMGVLVVDPHGEYTAVLPEMDGSERMPEVIKGSFISIGVPELSAWDISEFIPDMTVVQTRVLDSLIAELRKQKALYGLQDLIRVTEQSETINTRTKDALIGWLHSLDRTYLFSVQTNPIMDQMIRPGKITILDLSEIRNLRSRSIIVLHFLKGLYYQRIRNKIPPSVFVIEEAHQFCPQNQRSVSKRIIETIAREGRKFYVSLCLISQRPVNLSVTALSQCNSNLILRIRNPYDLDFIGRTSEGIDRAALKVLPDLEIGEALLVGEGVNYPVFFRVRARRLRANNSNSDLESVAESWSSNNSEK
ncbi:MAG: ATP-binding protein [Candidatus Heimdallarchaeota archaeon]